ncbi:flagellar hook-length control protein FliK [Congregibacter variabilis]|uniref:Flagellar hook-length control protein FliK n=1 Tax=Congregibacter variabilis TaxID=3081200 RepID=A0ABZ0I1D7_9GAMM|nr:flagellar hook-length control protein FliK [Congregibacter sp. IMCC43200]
MADLVNSPLLSVVPAEPAATKAAKVGNSAAKSGENDDFSRVLDGQRASDAGSQRSADKSSSATDTAGKALPPQGNEAADQAGNGSTLAADDNAPLAKDDSSAEAGNVSPRKSPNTLVGDEPANAAAGAGQFSASFDDSLALGSRAFPGAAADVTAQPEFPPVSVNSAVGKSVEALTLNTVAESNTAAPANLASNKDAPSTQASAVAQAVAVGASSATKNVLDVTRSDKPSNSGLAAGAALGASAVNSGGAPNAASNPTASLAVASAADDANLVAARVASPSAMKDSDALLTSPVVGDALSKGRSASAGERGSSLPLDSQTLNRSTADWLRSGMGSQAVGQRGLTDMPVDNNAELTRGLGTAQRADGPAPAASAVAGLTPASSAASTAVPSASVSTSAMPQYSLSRAPDDVEFSSELTARMKTLVRDGVREARLQLHPAELGRLQVTVTTEGDQTKVAFTAETAAARDAIEQSMPRLREMLEQSGLQLAQSDVGQRDLQGNGERGSDGQFAEQQGASEATDVDSPVLVTSTSGNGRIDTYI